MKYVSNGFLEAEQEKEIGANFVAEAKKRIQWVDVAKGICMLSVIAGHMGATGVNRVVYAYHLTVFFLLSGYTLKNNLSWETLKKRFQSLMIPYFLTCLAVTAMDVVNHIVVEKQTDFLVITQTVGYDILRSFMASGTITKFGDIDIGGRIGAIWFLPATFFAVWITQTLLKYISDKKVQYCAAVSVAILANISAGFLWLPFSIQSGMLAVPFLLLGYDLRQQQGIERISFRQCFLCLLIFLLGICLDKTRIYFVTASMPDILLSTVFALAASICIFYLSQKLENCRLLSWIGRNSIYFLCIHLFEMETMGAWFLKLIEIVGMPYNKLTRFLTKLIFITTVTAIILVMKKIHKRKETRQIVQTNRDPALDLAKAVLILLMLVGHFKVDSTFRSIVYSFHMMAFVFYSGYCFKPEACQKLCRSVFGLCKSFLIPYCVFGVLYVLTRHQGICRELQNLLFGMSFSQKVFTNFDSVGPVYFLLLLFLTRLLYLLMERFLPGEPEKTLTVLLLSVFGKYLGEHGYWLPWSLDCALYALIVYHLGYCFRKYGILEVLCERVYSYFALSCVWAYMIYKGGMELAVRNYGVYGIAVMGAVCASVLLYMLCRSLCGVLDRRLIGGLQQIGKSTLYILIIHAALNGIIGKYVAQFLTPGHLYYVVAMVFVQVFLGTAAGILVDTVKKHALTMRNTSSV